ncbi:MAG: hypothetical protein R3B84_20490 [Zavarzinella sp.]
MLGRGNSGSGIEEIHQSKVPTMSDDYLPVGPAPAEETCVAVGERDYSKKARTECQQYIQAIRAKLGQEPEGARLGIKSFTHDFGSYFEVVCYFEAENPKAVEYAYRCEGEAPTTWEEVGMTAPKFGRDLDIG